MATKNTQRSRMTALSKVNIKAAVDAKLIPAENGGYYVELLGASKETFKIENADGAIAYSSMANAKAAVRTHNSHLNPELKPTI